MTPLWSGKKRIAFRYVDAQGAETDRDLELHDIYEDGGSVYLQGFSHLRNDRRTFRAERIIGDVVDQETGEAASLEQLFEIESSGPAVIIGEVFSRALRQPQAPRKPRLKSGFRFPEIPRRKDPLVPITDETDYRDTFLDHLERDERAVYGEREFLAELDPSDLDLSFPDFLQFLTPDTLSAAGLAVPEALANTMRAVILEGGGDVLVPNDSPLAERLVEKEFLQEADLDDAGLREALSALVMPRLKEEAKKLGIKITQKKADLVEELAQRRADLTLRFLRNGPKMNLLIAKAGKAYVQDVLETLKPLPPAYALAAVDTVSVDGLIDPWLSSWLKKLSEELREKQEQLSPSTASREEREKLEAIRDRAKAERKPASARESVTIHEPSIDKAAEREARIQAYVKENSKSPLLGFLLAILIGPIGYLYVSTTGGVVAILLAVVFALMWFPLVFLVWIVCILAAPIEAMDQNKKLRVKAELMAGS